MRVEDGKGPEHHGSLLAKRLSLMTILLMRGIFQRLLAETHYSSCSRRATVVAAMQGVSHWSGASTLKTAEAPLCARSLQPPSIGVLLILTSSLLQASKNKRLFLIVYAGLLPSFPCRRVSYQAGTRQRAELPCSRRTFVPLP